MTSWLLSTLLLTTVGWQDTGYARARFSEDGLLGFVTGDSLRRGRMAFVDLEASGLRPALPLADDAGAYRPDELLAGRGEVLGEGELDSRRRGRRGRRGRRWDGEGEPIALVSSVGIWPAILISGRRMQMLDIECEEYTWDLQTRWIRLGAVPWADPAWAGFRGDEREIVIGDEAGRIVTCDLHRVRWKLGGLDDVVEALASKSLTDVQDLLDWLILHGHVEPLIERLLAQEALTPSQAAVAFATGAAMLREVKDDRVTFRWQDGQGELRSTSIQAADAISGRHGRLASSLLGAAGRGILEEARADSEGLQAKLRWLARQMGDLPSESESTYWSGRIRHRIEELRSEVLERLPGVNWIVERAKDEAPGVSWVALEVLGQRLRLEDEPRETLAAACESLIREQARHRGQIAWWGAMEVGRLDPSVLLKAFEEELAAPSTDQDPEIFRSLLRLSLDEDFGYDVAAWRAAITGIGDR